MSRHADLNPKFYMSKKIGIVTGGGDCPGLNAVIRAVAKAAAMRGWETLGILGGYAACSIRVSIGCWITRRSTGC